jgi:hypothetical protein
MGDTERFVKGPITRTLEKYAAFVPPEEGAREYKLRADGLCFKADFAYRLPLEGWLFIEDDDGPLANVTKYWFWLASQATASPIYLVHLIGPRKPGQRRLSEFIWEQAHEAYPAFHYRQIIVSSWHRPEEWTPTLEQVLDGILAEVTPEEQAGRAGAAPIENEPFVGMWKDREDMRDSTAWVRELRRQQWARG